MLQWPVTTQECQMLTVRRQVIDSVFELAKMEQAFDPLEERIQKFSKTQLKEALLA